MENRPLFSVITAVYNCEQYIGNVIKSVLRQDCNDYEYIIINDGSTDGTLEMIGVFDDSRIRVISQENQWVYAAMNRGVKEAKGEYVVLVNADDLLCTNVLSILKSKIENNNFPDVIWTNCYVHLVDEEQNIIHRDIYNIDEKDYTDELYNSCTDLRNAWVWMARNLININPHNAYKRELMLKHPFRNDVYGADTLMNIDLAEDIKKSMFIKEPLVEVLSYPQPEMNISKGNKYYDYTYEMFREITQKSIELLIKWGEDNLSNAKNYYYGQEILVFRSIAESLAAPNCPLSTDERVQTLMEVYLNKEIWSKAEYIHLEDKLIAGAVRGLKKILEADSISEGNKYYFLNHLIKVALDQEQPDELKMKKAVVNENNPYHVGSRIFKTLFGYDAV